MKIVIKRLIAFYLDMFFIILIISTGTIFINAFYDINNANNTNKIIIAIIIGILSPILLCSKDFLFKKNSLGKKIMNIKIYNYKNEIETNKIKLFLRMVITINCTFINFFTLIIFKKSGGDLILKTYVK